MVRVGMFSLGLALAVTACSSVNQPSGPTPTLDVASCLEVIVRGPPTVAEGKGFRAQHVTRNICAEAIDFPVAVDTSMKDGRDTGVELSFHLDVTDPQTFRDGVGQGYLVQWSSTDASDNYDDAQKMVTLAPEGELARTFTWNGRDDSGEVLPSGDYVLFGTFWYSPKALDDIETTVDIQGLQPFKIVPN